MSSPADVLRRLVASDPGRPRVTVYDDSDSPTRGERVELSARVVANWVAKAANLLQEDLDVAPGTVVLLDLPPHWRTLYWAFAVWSVGGCVDVPTHRCGATPPPQVAAGVGAEAEATADAGHPAPSSTSSTPATEASVVVTDDPATMAGALEAGAQGVLVTLAALARSATAAVPPGVVDEARDLATHGDVFDAWEEPDAGDPALRTPAGDTAYGTLTPRAGSADRVHTATGDTATFLRLALEVWAGDGSLVLGRGEVGEDVLAARLEAEGVTRRA